jgi:hypothetical protein
VPPAAPAASSKDAQDAVCCALIARQPLSEGEAAELAVLLKAVADPVRPRLRLRLLSMIGSHADGQACVCDLAGALDLDRPDDLPSPEDLARRRADRRGPPWHLGLLLHHPRDGEQARRSVHTAGRGRADACSGLGDVELITT